MSGATPEQLASLAEPVPLDEIKQRPAPGGRGKMLDYIDARFVMDRFDDAVGIANWSDSYRKAELTSDGVIARIGVKIEDEWVYKEDVGTESNIEGTKGSHSDAFKRCAVKWGVGRELYDPPADRPEAPKTAKKEKPVEKPVRKVTEATEEQQTANKGPHDISNDVAPWVCPTHDAVVVWPAGVSAAGRKYDAFYACPEGRGCPQRAPRGLKVDPAHLMDDLPF